MGRGGAAQGYIRSLRCTPTTPAALLREVQVQGVFFRKYTQEEAVRRGLLGYVRNTAQGTVVGEMEGSADNVEGM